MIICLGGFFIYIKFNQLRFRNINSYGNIETVFDFDQGLNSITGKNGQGKSTILEALCFVLFGTPYRKVNIKEIINRNNTKGLFTNITFSIKKDNYEITRKLKPSGFEIKKNGEKIELLSSKKLSQEELDKILGLDVTLFRQIISLAINANKPFLSLPTKDKRDIIETIFNIKVFGIMIKTVKQELASLKSDGKVKDNSLQILESQLRENITQLNALKKTQTNFSESKQKELKEIVGQIDIFQETIVKEQNQIDKYELVKNEEEKKTFEYTITDKQEINKLIGELEYKIKKGLKDLKFFKANDVCPVCDASLEGNEKEKHKEKIEKRIKETIKNVKEQKEKIKIIEKDLIERENSTNNISESTIGIYHCKKSIESIKKNIKIFQKNFKDAEEKTFSVDLKSMEESVEKKKIQYKEVFKETTKLKKDILIDESICNILGEEGIKSHFFKKLIPVLNQKINEYLELFDLPVKIRFNEFMEEEITVLGSRMEEATYHSFSEGEKKRIDIAILLSFIETTKLISNWSSNVLIFDELLDGSSDSTAMGNIMDAIKELTIDDANLCLYIISHRELDISFQNKYIGKKKGFFSTI